MKFKFCGDGDCPLWALAALHALGSLPAQLFRALVQHVLEEQPDDGIMEILKDTSLASRAECARAAAVIRWVVSMAVACSCGGAALARDLAVLGVPRQHAAALAEAASARQCDRTPIHVNRVTDVQTSPAPPGTVDACKLTLISDNVAGEQNRRDLLLDKSQALTLLEQLKKAYAKMEEIECQY